MTDYSRLIEEARAFASSSTLGKSQWRELDKAIGMIRRLADALEEAERDLALVDDALDRERAKSERLEAAIREAAVFNTHVLEQLDSFSWHQNDDVFVASVRAGATSARRILTNALKGDEK